MNRGPIIRSFVSALAMTLIGCATSTPQGRIAKRPEDFAALSSRQQALVQRGQIERGLTKPGVYFAWGSPDRVGEWERTGRRVERWTYFGYQPVQRYNFAMGAGYGHHGRGHYRDPFWYGGPEISYLPYTARRVDFRAGRVVDWESRLQ